MKRIRCASMGTALILVAAFHSIAFSESDESTPAVEQKADRGETQETFRCNSSKHIVIIDLVNDELRYRAWNKPRPITGKPDMEIGHGTQDWEGTGVCRHCQWTFGNGPVSYIVTEPGCAESLEKSYGWLRVEQNGKTISSWSCQHGEEPSQTMKTGPRAVEPTLAVATGTLLSGAQSDDSVTGTHIPVSQQNAWISREPGGTGGSWGDATGYSGNWTVNASGNSGAWSDNNGNSGTWSCNPGEEVEFYINRTKSSAYRCLKSTQGQPAPMEDSAASAQPSVQQHFGVAEVAPSDSTDTTQLSIDKGADVNVSSGEEIASANAHQDWKTYSSKIWGITFQYPRKYMLKEKDVAEDMIHRENRSPFQSATLLQLYDPKYVSNIEFDPKRPWLHFGVKRRSKKETNLKTFIQQDLTANPGAYKSVRYITIGEILAAEVDAVEQENGQKFTWIDMFRGNCEFYLSFGPASDPILSKVASTLRLIPMSASACK